SGGSGVVALLSVLRSLLQAGTSNRMSSRIAPDSRKRRTIRNLLALNPGNRSVAGARFLGETGLLSEVRAAGCAADRGLEIGSLDLPILGAGKIRERETVDRPGVQPFDGPVRHGHVADIVRMQASRR